MIHFEYITDNIDFYKKGVFLGDISTCVLNHFRIYSQLQNYLKMGYPITKAVLYTAEDNKVSEQTIFKIKKIMESEI
jgi:hypothetical protein